MPFSFELMNDQIKLYVYGVNMYMRENLKKWKISIKMCHLSAFVD